MDVILSWSGSQSRKVAEALRQWLKDVIPGIEPWISTEDIGIGTRWFDSLMSQLQNAATCILCLTPENVRSPWLYFEAGAIAGKGNGLLVCSLLIGVSGSQLRAGPLSQFQWTEATRDGTWKLLREINAKLDPGHDESLLQGKFSQKWPWLKRRLDAALTEGGNYSSDVGLETQPVPRVYQLTPEAEQLLLEAAQDRNGHVLMVQTDQGLIVQSNGKQMMEQQDARSEAAWRAAVRQLVQEGLLESRGSKGEIFGITAEGYRVADELAANQTDEMQPVRS